MSDTPAVQDWLGEADDPRARSLLTVRRHIDAETRDDTDAICATVSRDVFFAVPVRTAGGQDLPEGSVLTNPDAVREYYSRRAEHYVVRASSQLKSVATPWYVFNESAATLRATGPIEGVAAAGREFVVHSAILFPTAADGIRGEICITRHPFADVAAGRVVPRSVDGASPQDELPASRLLDEAWTSLRQGDILGLEARMASHHRLALRIDDERGHAEIHSGDRRADASSALCRILDGARDVSLITRAVSSWYAFAEFRVLLASSQARHLALLFSLDQGEISGTFGYGWTSSSAEQSTSKTS